jgi:hypothetical protein
MTVGALVPSVEYLENGVTLSFAAPFRFFAPGNLEVTRLLADGSVITLAFGTHWSATGGATDTGGTVTLVASVNGATLRIRRVTPRDQAADYTTNDRFPAESHEQALDKLAMIAQEQDVATADLNRRVLDVEAGAITLPLAGEGGSALIGLPGDGTVEDVAKFFHTPERYGAAGNANFFNTGDNKWYADAGFTVEATDDSAAIQAAIDACQANGGTVLLNARYRVVAQLNVTNGASMIGLHKGQNNGFGPGLCADHSLTSVRTSENDWTNAVVRVDNSSGLIGGTQLKNFGIYGTNRNVQNHDNRAPRTAIQGFFWINGEMDEITISGFTKSAYAMVGLCQDRSHKGLWISNCGTNTSSEYAAAIETRPSVSTYMGIAPGNAPNALHFFGCRFNGCPAYLQINNGTSNLGEIHFVGCKWEHRTWQVGDFATHTHGIEIVSGAGVVVFSASHFTVNQFENASGNRVWFMRVSNYQTTIADCTMRGAIQMLIQSNPNNFIQINGVRWQNAATAFIGMNIQAGDVDLTIHQDMNGKTSRRALQIGANVSLQLDVYSFIECSANITSGEIVLVPAGTAAANGPKIDRLVVHDDGSGFKQWFRLWNDPAGSGLADKANLRLGMIETPVTTITATLAASRYDVSTYGTRAVLDASGMTVDRIARSGVGVEITLIAGTNSFDLVAGSLMVTISGATTTIASGALTILKATAGDAVRQIA